MKFCPQCNQEKIIEDFPLKNGKPYSWCKSCNVNHVRKYKRTHRGLIKEIYRQQILRCTKLGRALPTYTEEWLFSWILSQPNFETLYSNWVNSKYKKDLIPSIDRINDNKSYTENNIQLITWKENFDNYQKAYRKKENPKIGVEVYKCDPQSHEILEYFPNIVLAAEAVGCSSGEITRVCKGRRKTAKGYSWRYKNVQ